MVQAKFHTFNSEQRETKILLSTHGSCIGLSVESHGYNEPGEGTHDAVILLAISDVTFNCCDNLVDISRRSQSFGSAFINFGV